MTDQPDDMRLAALLASARAVSPELEEDLLRKAYAIQRSHQFDRDRTISVQQMQRLIEEYARTILHTESGAEGES